MTQCRVSCDNDTVSCVGVPLYESQYTVNIVPTNSPQHSTPTWNNSVCHGVVSQVILTMIMIHGFVCMSWMNDYSPVIDTSRSTTLRPSSDLTKLPVQIQQLGFGEHAESTKCEPVMVFPGFAPVSLGGSVVEWLGRRSHNLWLLVHLSIMTLPGYFWDRWPSLMDKLSRCNQPPRSTQPCIPLGSVNRVPASAVVRQESHRCRMAGNTVWSHMACDFP